jgi:3-(3-hydroxy-phenyl)propionate hydroxylase
MDYELIIIGLGPVGSTAANLAGARGLRCLGVEADTEVYALPRAIHFDAEIMRVFQFAGLHERIEPLTRPATGSVHLGMDGEPIREFRVPAERGELGWRPHYNFYQPELEALLRAAAAARDDVDLRFGTRCERVDQDADGVTVTLRSASGELSTVTARHVMACDGATSTIRRQLGLELFDFGFEEPWIIIDTLVPDEGLGPDHMVMYCDPSRPGTYVPGPGRHRRWEFMVLPGEDPESLRTPEAIRAMIEPVTSWLDVDQAEVVRSAVYRFHGLVARQWSQGRVFLAGDAAHQTPPFYGQGMCHGIRDAHNLLWKLALVRDGVADEALLATYEAEREPHVRSIIGAAIANGRYICTLDRDVAQARDSELRGRMHAGGDVSSWRQVIPGLEAGLLDGEPGDTVGQLLPQPMVGGMALDDRLGDGFALVAARSLGGAVLPRWFRADGHRVVDEVAEVGPWLSTRGWDVVLVRPDRYVFGAAARAAAGDLVERLGARLTGDGVDCAGRGPLTRRSHASNTKYGAVHRG